MRTFLCLVSCLLPLSSLSAEPISLFDGKSLKGWTALAEGHVVAKDGEIQILAKGKNLWLLHDDEFSDFELTVETFMPEAGYNSGIGFRCLAAGKKPKGYQCEVANKESGQLYAIGSGWLWPKNPEEKMRFAAQAGDCFKVNEWNKFRIVAKGNHLRIWVNGTLTCDLQDDKFTKGRVALQHHGRGDLHRFRNILLKKL